MEEAAFSFELPPELNASAPPERRGLRRDHVRLMTLDRRTGETRHGRFFELDRYLRPGDLLVFNASRTLPAVLHGTWVLGGRRMAEKVEIRLACSKTEAEWEALVMAGDIRVGDVLELSGALRAELTAAAPDSPLVTLRFSLGGTKLEEQIYALGQPVRYEYITAPWDLDYYQTVFATVPGSVEMPSAGRPFSWELLFRLRQKGIKLAYLHLHTGLTYVPDERWHRQPQQNYEPYHVPFETMEAVRQAKMAGNRVIAVGTTVVRALETALDRQWRPVALSGRTNLYIDRHYALKVADGLITGFHEPEASHLALLSAFVAPDVLRTAYREAIAEGYLWHEFGDMNLIA